jgi:hypothetical protein
MHWETERAVERRVLVEDVLVDGRSVLDPMVEPGHGGGHHHRLDDDLDRDDIREYVIGAAHECPLPQKRIKTAGCDRVNRTRRPR